MENNQKTQMTYDIAVQDIHIPESIEKSIETAFKPFFSQAGEWKQKAESLVVTDESQTEEMKQAREARLALRRIRLGLENKRKELKEDIVKKGTAIDTIARKFKGAIEPIEEHLQEQEKFKEVQEAKRKAELRAARAKALEDYDFDASHYVNLEDMPDEAFIQLLDTAKAAYDSKQLQEQKEEEERKAREEAAEKERAELEKKKALYNQRSGKLKGLWGDMPEKYAEVNYIDLSEDEFQTMLSEAREAKKKGDEKRAAEKAKIKAAEEAKREAEAKLRARQEKEAKAAREAEEAEKAKRLAPDKDKLTRLAWELENYDLPEVNNPEAEKIMQNVNLLIHKISNYIRVNANKL